VRAEQRRATLTAAVAEPRGHTPAELARLLRVSPDRVRAWIANGELGALNLGTASRRPSAGSCSSASSPRRTTRSLTSASP